MHEFPIPVVAFGPGSQPDAEAANFMPMPSEMTTFALPAHDLEADPATLASACAVIAELLGAMQQTRDPAKSTVQIELLSLPREVVELLNQSLGHGEVSVQVSAPARLEIQETAFAGVWRVREISAEGVLQRDSLYAGALPPEVQRSALAGTAGEIDTPPLRPGMMNAPAVLNELQDRSRQHRPGQVAHVINLSLLPMSPEDLEYLYDAFGGGTVSILSRGYGNCRITSTRLPNVWWVQYFNSMDKLILNTIEVADMPAVALAATEDCQDSIERLGEWLDVMREQ